MRNPNARSGTSVIAKLLERKVLITTFAMQNFIDWSRERFALQQQTFSHSNCSLLIIFV